MINYSTFDSRRHHAPNLNSVKVNGFAIPSFESPRVISAYPELEALFRLNPTESIQANEVLFLEGDNCEFLFDIQSGCVRLQRIMDDGRRAIVTFLFDGDVVNALAAGRHRFTAEAVTPVEIRRLSRAKLMTHLPQAPDMYGELYSLGHEYMVNALEHNVILARLGAHGRMAAFLVWFGERFLIEATPSPSISLPMNRLDVADFLGLTIESVSRAMTRLREDGVISIPDTHRVILRDMPALRALAGVDGA